MRCNCFEVSLKKIFLNECFFWKRRETERKSKRASDRIMQYTSGKRKREFKNVKENGKPKSDRDNRSNCAYKRQE